MLQEKEIYSCLREIGCCQCCCVRYFCNKYIEFNSVEKYLTEKKFIVKNEETECGTDAKRIKENPCVVCLGLLQEFGINSILNIEKLELAKEYDNPKFTCSISMPPSIMLREKSVRLFLEEKFPTYFTEDKQEIALNKTWKSLIRNELGNKIGKQFENSEISDFSINISMDYSDNEKELSMLKEMQPKMFEDRKLQHKKFSGELFSRKAVMEALEKSSNALFKMYYTLPPEIPSKHVTCRAIECKHNPIYFAGRYCKYSRELSQTPWLINGVKNMENSVQDIIFEQIEKCFGISIENMKFSSSGREDCDVRCLGKGRPFYIEVTDPKKNNYTLNEFKQLEQQINNSKLVSTRDFQLVHRKDLPRIKEGEESKTKEYIALCVTEKPITDEMLHAINSSTDVTALQKTPIRVLHRRPLAVRSKTIYEMKAKRVKDRSNLFELYVKTQAGTYVKEFVHGDFGRTKPNLGDLIGMEVDIVALDVVAINLDWPPEIE